MRAISEVTEKKLKFVYKYRSYVTASEISSITGYAVPYINQVLNPKYSRINEEIVDAAIQALRECVDSRIDEVNNLKAELKAYREI